MEKVLISVVLPIYNVEKYLRRCIESVINQTYTNLEIILVDDGSTDNSGKICDEYKKKDTRIKVVHKSNGGLSDARNTGTMMSLGRYISYIDSDDYVDDDYIEYLYSLISRYKTKVALCTHNVVFQNGKTVTYGNGKSEILDAHSCIEKMLYNDVIDTSAWAKLYDIELAKSILYPQNKLFEDIATTYKFFLKSGKIACGYESKYYYIIRNNSIVGCSFNNKKLDLLEMTDCMGEEVLLVYPDLKEAVLRRRVYARFSTLNQMLDTDECKKEKIKIIRFIKNNSNSILHNKKVPKRDKIAVILLKISYNLYRAIWKVMS
nr:glycosyltransferase family 2 protein [uncultured Agathobacter sp.]